MLRGVFLAAFVALAVAAPKPISNVLELDISPEEAQKYLNSPPFTEPLLATRTAILPLVKYNDPRFRTAEAGPTLGHYWKNGREIENTEDYVDEVYNARQFHGQDGLGAYAYGYETPESAKVENKVRSGDVTGSYIYRTADNQLIKVRYWADSQGFHQEDNLPKVVLKPIEEAEDVRQARLAHEKAWQEAAAAARQQPDPQGEYYRQYDYQPAASEQQGAVVAAPSQVSQAREAKAYYGQGSQFYPTEEPEPTVRYWADSQGFHQEDNLPKVVLKPIEEAEDVRQARLAHEKAWQEAAAAARQQPDPQGEYYRQYDYQSAASEQQGAVVAAPSQVSQAREAKAYYGQGSQVYPTEEPEPTGPPRGFYYEFDYPVSIIKHKSEVQGQ